MEELFNNGIPLRDASPNITSSFYDNYMLPYLLNDGYLKLASNGSMRYFILDIGDDKVLVTYKFVKMFSVQYVRLMNFPKSLRKDHKLERKIFNLLMKQDIVKEAEISQRDLITHQIDYNKLEVSNSDFYSRLSEAHLRVNKSKYRSKHKINKYKDKLTFTSATLNDLDEINALLDLWKLYKTSSEGLHGKAIFKNLFKLYQTDGYELMCLKYEGKLLGITLFYKYSNKVRYIPVNIYYNATHLFREDMPKDLLQEIGQLAYYYIVNDSYDRDYHYINIGGSINIDGSLFKFKENLYKGKILYYKLKKK